MKIVIGEVMRCEFNCVAQREIEREYGIEKGKGKEREREGEIRGTVSEFEKSFVL